MPSSFNRILRWGGVAAICVQIAPAPAQTTINDALGRPNRLLMGLGANNELAYIQSHGIKPDIIDTYLVGVGPGQWPYYNSPVGSYVTDVADQVTAIGAIPMFTLYQMATYGGGNLTHLTDSNFMTAYWAQTRLMFQKLGSFGKPVLVNIEPDFWGYADATAPGGDPRKLATDVSIAAECSALPNTAAGIAPCMIKMRNDYAPNAKIGFPPAFFGATLKQLGQYMNVLGANKADFMVAQTIDRDAGCPEAASPPPECAGRGAGPFYWDVSNTASPNFNENLAEYSGVSEIEGKLPILYWQTPMGVPSKTPGGTTNHYRDDHVYYMFSHPGKYAAANVFGIVFSAGATSQTTISTDGGQYATALAAYLKKPTPIGIIPNGVYSVSNHFSGLALDDPGAAKGTSSTPAAIDQSAATGLTNQRWALTYRGDNTYALDNVAAGQPLSVANAGGASSLVDLIPKAGAANQVWTITQAAAGYFTLSPSYNHAIVLDDPGLATSSGTHIDVYFAHVGSTGQQWSFKKD